MFGAIKAIVLLNYSTNMCVLKKTFWVIVTRSDVSVICLRDCFVSKIFTYIQIF